MLKARFSKRLGQENVAILKKSGRWRFKKYWKIIE